MAHQSGSSLGGGGRGGDVFGDRVSGANTFSDGSGVYGSGVDDIDMGLGESSNGERNSGPLTGSLGSQALSGGLGRPSEAVAGAGREQGAQAQSLEELMAMILKNAGQGDGLAAGSGSAWRDDVSARSSRFAQRCRQLCHERPGDRSAAWRAVLALFQCTFSAHLAW